MLTLTIGHPLSENYGGAMIINPPCNQEKYSNKSANVCGACKDLENQTFSKFWLSVSLISKLYCLQKESAQEKKNKSRKKDCRLTGFLLKFK